MRRLIHTAVLCSFLSACSTLPNQSIETPADIADAKPVFQVQPASRISEDLFAIEDPLALAVEARWNGDHALAYSYFYKAWLATPQNEDVVIGLVDMALRTGHLEQAYSAADKIKVDADRAKAKLVTAKVLAEIAVGKSSDPELRLNQALENDPTDPRLWNALGRFHDSTGAPLRAQDAYLQALAVGGSDASVINNLGMSLLMQGQREAAFSKFEQAAELQPDTPLYDNNRRLTLALLGDYKGATEGLPSETASDILNDAGFIAKTRNETVQATTLFKAAIDSSETYHARAHENLRALSQ